MDPDKDLIIKEEEEEPDSQQTIKDAQPSGVEAPAVTEPTRESMSQHNPIEIKEVAKKLGAVDHFSLICIGMRRTGKTYIVDAILAAMAKQGQHFDIVYLFSETAWKLSQWMMIPKALRYEGFQADILKEVLTAQRRALEHNEETEEIDHVRVPRCLVVLDDVNADRGIKWGHSSDELQRLYVQGRHSAISVITLLQHPKAVPPSV